MAKDNDIVSIFFGQSVPLEKHLISSLSTIFHFWIKLEHLPIDTVHSSCYLPSNSANSIAIPAHVGIHYRNFFEIVRHPNCVKGHSEGVHAVRTHIIRLVLGSSWRIAKIFIFPVPVSILKVQVKPLELFAILLAHGSVIIFRFLHA